MNDLPLSVNDEKLLLWFKSNYNNIKFIGKSSDFPISEPSIGTKILIDGLKVDQKLHFHENINTLMTLWRNLLGDAIIFLKSEDEREKYHDGEVFGTNALFKVMETFKDFEKLLYGAKEYYRDHIAHVFRVFLLGEYLIRERIGFEKIQIGREEDPDFAIKISADEKEAMWCIISLTHDIGYALEDIDKINDKMRGMIKKYGKASVQELVYLFPPQRYAIDDFILRFISSNLVPIEKGKKFSTHLQSKYFLKFYRAYEKLDHGIISCTVLMRELVFFLESDFLLDQAKQLNHQEARQFLIRQGILRAIAAHNCEDIYHLTGQNFLFVLAICDELQEWGRPRMEEVLKETVPEREVIIRKFDCLERDGLDVGYEVIFKETRSETQATVRDYFAAKAQKYVKILRSAVDGERRNISLSFTVLYMIKDTGKSTTYKFAFPQPIEGQFRLEPTITIDGKIKSLRDITTSDSNDKWTVD